MDSASLEFPLGIGFKETATPGVYNTVTGWMYSIDYENYYPLTEDFFTEEMVEETLEYGFGNTIYIYAIYEDVVVDYTVTDFGGNLAACGNSEDFVKSTSNLSKGSVITLWRDMELSLEHGESVEIKNEVTLNLGGFTLTVNPQPIRGADSGKEDASNSGFFKLLRGAKLSVYSSEVGGEIVCGTEMRYRTLAYLYNNSTLNLGKAGDSRGEDAELSIYFPIIVESLSDLSSPKKYESIKGEERATVNINGGNYTGYSNKTYAIFNARHACDINITNANVSSCDDEMFTTDMRYDTGLNLVVKNSSLYTTSTRGLFYYTYYKNSKFEFDNCEIISPEALSYSGGDAMPGTYYVMQVINSGKTVWLFVDGAVSASKVESYVRKFYSSATSIKCFSANKKTEQAKFKAVECTGNNSARWTTYIDKNGNKLESDPTLGDVPITFKGENKISAPNGIADLMGGVTVENKQVKANVAANFSYFVGDGFTNVNEYSYSWATAVEGSDKYAEITFNDSSEPEYWYVGSELGKNEYAVDGLYNKIIDYRTEDGKLINTVVAGTYKVIGNGEYVYEANIQGMKVNLTANNGFIVNFYVPVGLGVSGSVEGAVYDDKYTVYSVKTSVAGDGVASVTFTFTVDGVGELSETVSVSIVDYFNAVLAQSTFDEAAMTLVVNAANYANELYKFANDGADFEGYKAIIEANKDRIIKANALPVDVNAQEQTAFDAVAFIISDGNVPMFAFRKIGEGEVTVKYTDVYGNDAEVVCSVVTVNGTEYYAAEEMPVYEMIDAFEVYVDGVKVGDYSIANYVDVTADPIAEALWGYGVAARNYKLS